MCRSSLHGSCRKGRRILDERLFAGRGVGLPELGAALCSTLEGRAELEREDGTEDEA